MVYPTAKPFLPKKKNYKNLASAAQGCRGCDLYKRATQAVFGEGNKSAKLVFVGEQPGNAEDLQGHPFVGPAGKLLSLALEAAGLQKSEVYITNAVKHFKWEERGKMRIHKRPSVAQVNACTPWLSAEVELLKPKIVICLGATAARAVFKTTIKIGESRGQFFETDYSAFTFVTVHPSAILRAGDRETLRVEREKFFADIKSVAKKLKSL
jgi:uracil-DNA glycosylase family protein